jgi:hypothetical protein
MVRRSVNILVAVAVLVSAVTFAPPAQAMVYWRFVNYYDANMNYVGSATRDCSGQWTYSGQQSGRWKEENDVSCWGPPIEHAYYYEYCNGNWVPVSELFESNC